MVHVDYDTRRRTPKASAHWYAEVIRDTVWPHNAEASQYGRPGRHRQYGGRPHSGGARR